MPLAGGLALRPVKERRRKTIWLAEPWRVLLRAHREEQLGQQAIAGDRWQDHGLVFCGPLGSPRSPREDYAEWQAILTAAGLPSHRVHAMRHFAGTTAHEEGVDLMVVQQMLGHADIRQTQGYVHPGRRLALDASQRMADVLLPPEPG